MFHPEGPSFFELTRQALSSTERGYDLLAPKFENTPFRTPDTVLRAVAQRLPEVDDALDLCCGTGAALRAILPRVRRRLVGLDMSQGMLDQAAILRPPGGVPEVSWVRGDALDTPFADASFDLVVSFGAFGHILEADEPRLCRELARLIRPGGRFAFATFPRVDNRNWRVWTARAFNATMRVRNALRKPEFIMYYLSFTLPRARALLEAEGFQVRATGDLFRAPYQDAVMVEAVRL